MVRARAAVAVLVAAAVRAAGDGSIVATGAKEFIAASMIAGAYAAWAAPSILTLLQPVSNPRVSLLPAISLLT